jgi:hypothetical protein
MLTKVWYAASDIIEYGNDKDGVIWMCSYVKHGIGSHVYAVKVNKKKKILNSAQWIADANIGFQFSNWTQNLGHDSTRH